MILLTITKWSQAQFHFEIQAWEKSTEFLYKGAETQLGGLHTNPLLFLAHPWRRLKIKVISQHCSLCSAVKSTFCITTQYSLAPWFRRLIWGPDFGSSFTQSSDFSIKRFCKGPLHAHWNQVLSSHKKYEENGKIWTYKLQNASYFFFFWEIRRLMGDCQPIKDPLRPVSLRKTIFNFCGLNSLKFFQWPLNDLQIALKYICF